MSKLIKRLSGDFTIISNKVFRNKKLGVTDRGTLCTLLSLPDNWNFSTVDDPVASDRSAVSA